MKIKYKIVTSLLIVTSAFAAIEISFPGWDWLEEKSPDIAIVNCGKPTPNPAYPYGGVINGTMSDSEIRVIFVLKGTNGISSVRLQTDHELRQGEDYLVFGNCDNGIYDATEEFRVVPLGVKYAWELNSLTNSIASKSLDKQIQILFQRSIDNLNHEIQKDQEEKARLEEGLKK
jgi:hypothetical protein